MARSSPEHRSGELWRSGLERPPPPAELAEPERNLWRAITAAKPVDWFDAASLPLLRRYVRTAVHAEKLHDRLARLPVGGAKAADLLRQVIGCNSSLGVLASRMRLNQQVSISSRSTGRMAWRGSPLDDDPLIGGNARQQ